ncbi:hypothetical protein [Desulfovibrio sp. ZJ369]|uniref:hypothetical protein n=1 Tax=Desulfovibrio sp. ZJ369 TaxID=2709793 RepID=UPI0013ED6D25|nr:hypothetical protein [Desulfovibrio sp. ZJ369]
MKRLADTSFAELLPSSLASDSSMRAAAQALDAVQPKTLSGIPSLLLWARLLEDGNGILPPLRRLAGNRALPPLSETELDLLAWQLPDQGGAAARYPR